MSHMIVDEYQHLFSDSESKDRLRQMLCSTEGIPNVQYLVKNGKVFVFEKLVSLMQNEKSNEPEKARELLPLAWLTPMQAVMDWEVVPYPFEVHGTSNSNSWHLYHPKLDAIIPKKFDTWDQVNEALVILLLGYSVPPDPTELMSNNLFYYEQQAFKSLTDLDVIPADPLAQWDDMTDGINEILPVSQYRPGHPLLTEMIFSEIGSISDQWKGKLEWMYCWVKNNDLAISKITTLPLNKVNEGYGSFGPWNQNEDDKRSIATLRGSYPELNELNDLALYLLFHDFKVSCNNRRGAGAGRDIDFLFYAVGAALEVKDYGTIICDAGKVALYLITEEVDSDKIAMMISEYVVRDKAIRQLSFWRWHISQFLENVSKTEKGCGPAIVAFPDLMRMYSDLSS